MYRNIWYGIIFAPLHLLRERVSDEHAGQADIVVSTVRTTTDGRTDATRGLLHPALFRASWSARLRSSAERESLHCSHTVGATRGAHFESGRSGRVRAQFVRQSFALINSPSAVARLFCRRSHGKEDCK